MKVQTGLSPPLFLQYYNQRREPPKREWMILFTAPLSLQHIVHTRTTELSHQHTYKLNQPRVTAGSKWKRQKRPYPTCTQERERERERERDVYFLISSQRILNDLEQSIHCQRKMEIVHVSLNKCGNVSKSKCSMDNNTCRFE